MNKKNRLDRIEYFLEIDHLDGWPAVRSDGRVLRVVLDEIYKQDKHYSKRINEIENKLNVLTEYFGIQYVPEETKTKPARYRKKK